MTDRVIVFVTPQLKTGGGNRVFVELANVLANKFTVKLIYPNNSPDTHTFYVSEAVDVMEIGNPARSHIGKLVNLLKTISFLNKEHRNSTVIISDPILCIFGFMLTMNSRYRFVQADDYHIFDDRMIIRQAWLLILYKILAKISYKYKLTPFFNSKYTFKKFIEVNGNYALNEDLVHPAINQQIFRPGNAPLSNQKIQICLVARKHPWKGLATFIEAWNSLPDVYVHNTEVTLISHDDLSEYQLSNMQIVRPSSDQEIAGVFQASDIFISTSWWEGFGLPPLEAMACGCAVITSSSGGVDEYAVDGRNCLMFEPKNVAELQEKLILLLTNDSVRQRLSEYGVSDAQKFSWNRSANQLIAILSK